MQTTAQAAQAPEHETRTPVVLRVTPAEAQRIVRALEETSSLLAFAPSGSRVASSYRRLAANLRGQAADAIDL